MQTFWHYYRQKIQPQVAAIDLFLKTEDAPYPIEDICALLGISAEEGEALLSRERISVITKGVFFRLMQLGSSPLCGMLRRVIADGLPQEYTPQEIAYIFDLPQAAVDQAASELGEQIFSEQMLPQLFRRIPISDKQYQK